MVTSVGVTLWINFNIHCDEEYTDSNGHKVSYYKLSPTVRQKQEPYPNIRNDPWHKR